MMDQQRSSWTCLLYTSTVNLHTRVAIKASALHNATFTEAQNNSYLITTVGKIFFNDIFDGQFPFINEPGKENLSGTPVSYTHLRCWYS